MYIEVLSLDSDDSWIIFSIISIIPNNGGVLTFAFYFNVHLENKIIQKRTIEARKVLSNQVPPHSDFHLYHLPLVYSTLAILVFF